jgi:branched-chain amino acid aminotransferase
MERAGWGASLDLGALARAVDSLVRRQPGEKSVRFELLERPLVREGLSTSMLIGVGPHMEVPSALLERGASLGLSPPGLARPVPLIKYSDWVVVRRVCESHAPHAFEWLLLDANRRILEGTSSNFYALLDGTVVTAGEGVLEGITGQIVRELIAARGVPLRFERLAVESLADCSEAFITSSSREVVPVSSVDGVPIGSGEPGNFATSLRREFRAYAEANAKPAIERA